ncbi:MAG TPA: copper ion binding protein [Spirochaetota bacterium]|nr:copper ion binding protein [Spirochaetota bacterium]HRS79217.1 copper ion binding protein [Spirochaetota bacterium]
MKQIVTAPGMSCMHCKMTIEKAVKGLPGIASVNADPDTKKVEINFDEKTVTLEAIRRAIEEAGYDVE